MAPHVVLGPPHGRVGASAGDAREGIGHQAALDDGGEVMHQRVMQDPLAKARRMDQAWLGISDLEDLHGARRYRGGEDLPPEPAELVVEPRGEALDLRAIALAPCRPPKGGREVVPRRHVVQVDRATPGHRPCRSPWPAAVRRGTHRRTS